MALLPLGAQELPGQHSRELSAASLGYLNLGGIDTALFQASFISQAEERFRLSAPLYLSASLGLSASLPSNYSDTGLRYRGYSSAFGALRLGYFLPVKSIAPASLELGGGLHIASHSGTLLGFGMAEVSLIFRLPDQSPRPFYASWSIDGQARLRAEARVPLTLLIRRDGLSLGLGLGLGIRRDSYRARP